MFFFYNEFIIEETNKRNYTFLPGEWILILFYDLFVFLLQITICVQIENNSFFVPIKQSNNFFSSMFF